MNNQLKYGDKVVIIDGLHRGRVGTLIDPRTVAWDFLVKLEKTEAQNKQTIGIFNFQADLIEDQVLTNVNYGDRVIVKNSLLYTGRTGVLGPISDNPADFWNFEVELDETKDEKSRVIGVMDYQVELCNEEVNSSYNEWKNKVDQLVEATKELGRLPEKGEKMFPFLNVQRRITSKNQFGTLVPEREAYMNEKLPGWKK